MLSSKYQYKQIKTRCVLLQATRYLEKPWVL